ncbi:MAG: glycosyltransferase family 4 protein [Halopenitus sp.]
MHIVNVCQDFPPDARGIGQRVYHFSKRLVKRGHDVTVLTRGPATGTTEESYEGVNVYRVRFLPLYPFHLHVHSRMIEQTVDSFNQEVDVVVLHTPLVPKVAVDAPTIVWSAAPTVQGIQNRGWSDLFSVGMKIFRPILERVDEAAVRSGDYNVAVSETSANELRSEYDLENVEVVSSGIDIDKFSPVEDKTSRGGQILYAGALDGLKGLSDLIEASETIISENPECKFIIAGDGPMRPQLESAVNEKGLADSFEFLGFIEQSELVDLYRFSTLFVNPSYHEALPMALREAMACGTPVIATDVPGNNEIITDGHNGVLVPPAAPEELAGAILSLLGDRETMNEMRIEGRATITAEFSWDTITDQFEQIFTELKD